MTPPLHAIIMAGGSGTRFWPASRRNRPKQFLPLAQGRSLLQGTVDRVHDLCGPDRTWIVTNPVQARSLDTALADFPSDHVIVEPEPRDTAPCVALAAATIEATDPGATMAVMPADQFIQPAGSFHALLRRAATVTESTGALVTLGLPPTTPATGFGYIQPGKPIDSNTPSAHRVNRFIEKPDLAAAKTLRESGALWNSGIFVWNYAALTAAMKASDPVLLQATEGMLSSIQNRDTAALESHFLEAPRTSIDFALMEKAPNVVVVRADLRWSDLGSFLALGAVGETTPPDNVTFTADGAETFLQDSSGCLVYGEGQRTICLFGTQDLVVVCVDDAVLVCPKDRAEDLKTLIQSLRRAGRDDLL